MVSQQRLVQAWASVVCLLYHVVAAAPTIPITYCSSLNTATTDENVSIYQSDGHCHDWCFQQQNYALAILNYQTCWCSNFIPDAALQVSPSECNNPCPGYPSDFCGGGSGSNLLYAYLKNDAVQPSGTSSPAAAKPSTSAPPPSPSRTNVDSGPTPITTNEPTVDIPPPQLPSVIIQTVTAGGQVTTVTSVPSNTSVPITNGNVSGDSSGGKISSGATAGICIAAIGAAAVVGGMLLWFKRKRNHDGANADSGAFEIASKRGSSAGIMTTPRTTELSENRFAGGADSRVMAENWEASQPGRRRSTLMPVDPRLDFAKGVYARNENPSHESINSLQDNEDYSRRVHVPKPLRAVNPDPD